MSGAKQIWDVDYTLNSDAFCLLICVQNHECLGTIRKARSMLGKPIYENFQKRVNFNPFTKIFI